MSHLNLASFFLEELIKINEKRGKELTQESVWYLSNVLLSGLNKEFVFRDNQKQYLVDLYDKSRNAVSRQEKFINYKYLGDYSLFISGYFTESISDLVGVDYYIDMGSQAYIQASLLNDGPYIELSKRYPYCVSLINEFSAGRISRSTDIFKLYSFWMSTKSKYAKEKLFTLGIMTEIINE